MVALNVTFVAPVKLVPVIVIESICPATPVVTEIDEITGMHALAQVLEPLFVVVEPEIGIPVLEFVGICWVVIWKTTKVTVDVSELLMR